MLQTRYYAQWLDLLKSFHTYIAEVQVHNHNYGQATWFTFVVAELSTRPASLLNLDHAFVVTAAQKAHFNRQGYGNRGPESCSTCVSHLKSWRDIKMEQEIQQMRSLSSFL